MVSHIYLTVILKTEWKFNLYFTYIKDLEESETLDQPEETLVDDLNQLSEG